MNCIKCYREIPDGSKFCPYCGADQSVSGQTDQQPNSSYQTGTSYQNDTTSQSWQTNQPVYQPEKPVNWVPYLVLSIISTVCCCLPFGIVAIVFSAKINSSVNAGDMEAAHKAAKTAKIWIIVAFIVGIISNILVYVFYGSLLKSGIVHY